MTTQTETMSLRVAPEVKAEFSETMKALGGTGTQGDFVSALLSIYKEYQVENNTDSPTRKEMTRVKKSLIDVERLVAATLDVAASDRTKAIDDAKTKVTTAQTEVAELKEASRTQKESIVELGKKSGEQEKIIAGLRESAESVQALKDAWGIEKGNLTTRIAELDSEAKEAQELKGQVSDLEKSLSGKERDLVNFQGKLALADQQHRNDQGAITDIKTQLAEEKQRLAVAKDEHGQAIEALKHENKTDIETLRAGHEETIGNLKSDHMEALGERVQTIETLQGENTNLVNGLNQTRADLQQVKENLNAEKLQAKEKELEIQKDNAEEHGRLVAQVEMLEKSLLELKKGPEQL